MREPQYSGAPAPSAGVKVHYEVHLRRHPAPLGGLEPSVPIVNGDNTDQSGKFDFDISPQLLRHQYPTRSPDRATSTLICLASLNLRIPERLVARKVTAQPKLTRHSYDALVPKLTLRGRISHKVSVVLIILQRHNVRDDST